MARPAVENITDPELSVPRNPPALRDGDVIVTRESRPEVYYTVRQSPGIVQFRVGALEQAVRLARGFGQKQAVDVWFSEGGTLRLLEAHRPQTMSGAVADRRTDEGPGQRHRAASAPAPVSAEAR